MHLLRVGKEHFVALLTQIMTNIAVYGTQIPVITLVGCKLLAWKHNTIMLLQIAAITLPLIHLILDFFVTLCFSFLLDFDRRRV